MKNLRRFYRNLRNLIIISLLGEVKYEFRRIDSGIALWSDIHCSRNNRINEKEQK